MKSKINFAITALFLVLIFGFGIAFWVLPDKDFSPEENRVLQGSPTVSTEGWLDGSFSEKLTEYFSDQFPMRSYFVNLHALSELGRGASESAGVLYGDGGQLAVRRFDVFVSRTARAEDTDFYRPEHVQKGLDALCALHATLAASDIPLTVLLAPRTVDVAAADFDYPTTLSDRLDETVRNGLASLDSVELLSRFREMHNAGDYVYYRTDHHWTTLGAYIAYTEVMASFDMESETLPADFFTVRTVADFYGTTHARAGLSTVPPDDLEIWEAADGSDAHFTVRDADGKAVIESGFISEDYLLTKDKYGAFLDGTHRLLTVTDREAAAAGVSRPRLLVARDSFASAMIPFLARHFDIVAVNLTGGMTSLSELAVTHECERVLVVCNRENLITSDCLTILH